MLSKRVAKTILLALIIVVPFMYSCSRYKSEPAKITFSKDKINQSSSSIMEKSITGSTIDEAVNNLLNNVENDEAGGVYIAIAEKIASQDISIYAPQSDILGFEICASFHRQDDEAVTASDIELSFALSFLYNEKEYLMVQYTDSLPSLPTFEKNMKKKENMMA